MAHVHRGATVQGNPVFRQGHGEALLMAHAQQTINNNNQDQHDRSALTGMRDVYLDNLILQDLIPCNNTLTPEVDLTILVNSIMAPSEADPVTLNTLVTHLCTAIWNKQGREEMEGIKKLGGIALDHQEAMERIKNLGGIALDHRETALGPQGSTFPLPMEVKINSIGGQHRLFQCSLLQTPESSLN